MRTVIPHKLAQFSVHSHRLGTVDCAEHNRTIISTYTGNSINYIREILLINTGLPTNPKRV